MIHRMRRSTRYSLKTVFFSFAITCLGIVGGLWAFSSETVSHEEAQKWERRDLSYSVHAQQAQGYSDPREHLKLDPNRFEREGDHYIQRLNDGRVVVLTLDPKIQKKVTHLLEKRKPPHGALVAIEPSTGRVLALVSRSYASRPSHHFALKAQAPSASVFKLVTAAALLDMAKINPKKKICYRGGLRYLTPEMIKGDSLKNKEKCADLGMALAHSLNVVMARLAYYHLSKANLEQMALRFGFNRQIPFELPVDISTAVFVDDDIERARTAAGFWNVNLSPLHGAMIAAAIANDGIMMRPTLVDRIVNRHGVTIYQSQPEPWLLTLSPNIARKLAHLASGTTTVGTAADAFTKRSGGWKGPPVMGKTGTLSNKKPFMVFTWFVGASPIEHAKLAVGALVANGPKWWIKGMHLAALAFLSYTPLKK